MRQMTPADIGLPDPHADNLRHKAREYLAAEHAGWPLPAIDPDLRAEVQAERQRIVEAQVERRRQHAEANERENERMREAQRERQRRLEAEERRRGGA
jgi:hypothetical protein